MAGRRKRVQQRIPETDALFPVNTSDCPALTKRYRLPVHEDKPTKQSEDIRSRFDLGGISGACSGLTRSARKTGTTTRAACSAARSRSSGATPRPSPTRAPSRPATSRLRARRQTSRVAGVRTPAFVERRTQVGSLRPPGHDGGFGILRRRRVWIVGLRLGPGERFGPGRWRSPRPSTCAFKGPVIFPWPPQTPHSKIPRRPEPPHA